MLRIIAILFGIVFIFIGVAGFLTVFTPNGLLFSLFMVSTLHNFVHIISGVIAIMAATSVYYTRLFFQVFGVLYALLAIIGFWRGDLFIMHVNTADNLLHLGIGVVAIYLGFASFRHVKQV